MSRLQPKILGGIVVLVIFALGLSVLVGGRYIAVKPRLLLAGEARELNLKEPLVVQFSFPVNRRSLVPSIAPPVEGTWEWRGGVLGGHLARTAVFTPDTVWAPDQRYSVTFAGLGPLLTESPTAVATLDVSTKPLPVIIAASISENATNVPADSTINLTLDQPLTDEVDFSFRLEPAVELTVAPDPSSNKYAVRPVTPLVAGQLYRLVAERELVFSELASGSIVRRGERQKVFERLFTVKTPPQITALTPSGDDVGPAQKNITIDFSVPMNRSAVEQAIKLTPNASGVWRWETDQRLNYDLSTALELDTSYQITIPAGVTDQLGDPFADPVVVGFRTVGALRLVTAVPNRTVGVAVTAPIRLTFNQLPNVGSIRDHLTISPAVPISLEPSGRAIVISPQAPFGYNTKYTLVLAAGAVGQYDRPSRSETIVTFTTEEKVVLLNIAWDRQDRALSCEAAALKMALAGKGVRVSEDDIMAQVGYDPTPRTSDGWGDPDSAFVGDVNGAQNTTGYGVHWGPIARAASTWRQARSVTGMSLTDAARELEAGNPIVIWGVTGPSYYNPWFTPSGKKVEAWKGEHARTLIGFRGSVENPTSFIINDPLSGRVNWSAAKLRANWATFSFAGVVVY